MLTFEKQEAPQEIKLLAGEREPNESDLMVLCCNEFLRLGPRRTLKKLAKHLVATGLNARLQSEDAINQYCWRFKWKYRARLYDAQMESDHHLQHKDAWEAITRNTVAQSHVRIAKLLALAQALEEIMYNSDVDDAPHNHENSGFRDLWVKKVAKNGSEYHEFNSALVEQYRGVLRDIAEEAGGRKAALDLNVNAKIENQHTLPPSTQALMERIYASLPPPEISVGEVVEGEVNKTPSGMMEGVDEKDIPF